MRIAHFLQYYLPAIGGGVKFVHETGTRLLASGHQLTVLTSTALENIGLVDYARWRAHRTSGPGLTRIDGVEVRRHNPVFLPGMGHLPFIGFGPITPGLIADILNLDVDLLHTSAFPYAHNIAADWAARNRRIPLVATPYYKPGISISAPLRRVLKDAARIQVPVRWEKRAICGMHAVDPEKIDIVPSGVDHNVFTPRDIDRDQRYILFVGRLTYDKGISHLAQAFTDHLSRQYRDLRLVIVGLASEWARQNLPVGHGSISMTGPIWDTHRLAELYALSELVCYPSRDDCFPHVILESWACGRPVVGCSIGGVADVIEEEKDGLFVKFGETRDIAEKIASMLDDPRGTRRMGMRGRTKVLRRFTWDKVTSLLEASYEKALRS